MPSIREIAAFLEQENIPFRMEISQDIQITGFSSLSRYRPICVKLRDCI